MNTGARVPRSRAVPEQAAREYGRERQKYHPRLNERAVGFRRVGQQVASGIGNQSGRHAIQHDVNEFLERSNRVGDQNGHAVIPGKDQKDLASRAGCFHRFDAGPLHAGAPE